MTGTVKAVVLDRGFGFIAAAAGDVFFHANELRSGLEFDERLQERRVEFETSRGQRGPHAVNVRPAE